MRTASPSSSVTSTSGSWSPARIYLLASGIFLAVTSPIGLFLDRSFPLSKAEVFAHEGGHIFGILETNGWHNLAGLAGGIAALIFASRADWSRTGALLLGGIYVVVTAGIAIFGPETFLIESNTADQIVHGSFAALGLLTGLLTPRTARPDADQVSVSSKLSTRSSP